jgi:hypothetical protein
MTTPSFGKIYNLEAIDSSSLVSLTSCPESVSYLTQYIASVTPQGHQYLDNLETQITPLVSLIDNDGEREFSVLTTYAGNYTLNIYTITVSFPQAITLLSSTTFPLATSASEILNFFFGIKKINDSLYCVYYSTTDCNGQINITVDKHVRFRKVSIIPATSYTDDILEEITLSYVNVYRWQLETTIVINKKGYVGLIREGKNVNPAFQYSGYCLDMDTDTVSSTFTYDINYYTDDGGYDHSPRLLDSWTLNHGKSLMFYSSLGVLKWIGYYQDNISKGFISGYGAHFIVNGTDTLLEQINYPGITSFHCDGFFGVIGGHIGDQYTSKDGVGFIAFTWTLDTTKNVAGRANSDSTVSIFIPASTAPTSMYSPTPVRSESIFPGIAKTTFGGVSTTFTTINPTDGISTGTLSILDVSEIYTLFPTLDTGDNSLYTGVKMTDDSYKVLGINPSSGAVNNIVADIDFHGAYNHFFNNHGNFFVDWDTATNPNVTITYLLNFPTGNFIQAIMEMN